MSGVCTVRARREPPAFPADPPVSQENRMQTQRAAEESHTCWLGLWGTEELPASQEGLAAASMGSLLDSQLLKAGNASDWSLPGLWQVLR